MNHPNPWKAYFYALLVSAFFFAALTGWYNLVLGSEANTDLPQPRPPVAEVETLTDAQIKAIEQVLDALLPPWPGNTNIADGYHVLDVNSAESLREFYFFVTDRVALIPGDEFTDPVILARGQFVCEQYEGFLAGVVPESQSFLCGGLYLLPYADNLAEDLARIIPGVQFSHVSGSQLFFRLPRGDRA